MNMNSKVNREAPFLQCFRLTSTFFGFNPRDRVKNHENIFNLIWFGDGRWSWDDVYHMPIFLRSYWIDKCNEIREQRIAQSKQQNKRSTTPNLPTKRRR